MYILIIYIYEYKFALHIYSSNLINNYNNIVLKKYKIYKKKIFQAMHIF